MGADDDGRDDIDDAAGSIGPLSTVPVFLRAKGRRVVIAGGSEAAAWKADLMASAEARVDVYAAEPCERLVRAHGQSRLSLHRRLWAPEDLESALIGVIDADSDEEAAAFRQAAHAGGAMANAIDRPAFCDVQFGAIVNRSPLVIGIATGGAAPVFAQALRARIETIAPAGFAAWARAARDWRADLAGRALSFQARRKFWERFAALAFSRPAGAPSDQDRATLLEAAESAQGAVEPGRGRVTLVGAGPGDPELLTLRAVRALQNADVVLFDDLISPAVLDFARREADRIDVGKRGYRASHKQNQISAQLVALASAGKNVVRLKGGDPMVFGRANEEIEALQAAGVEVEVVPGITAASGAAASLLASLTERDLARRVQFVTAHGRDGRLPDDLDWRAIADPKATTAVYMGVRTLRTFAERAMAAGLAAGTPAILVDRATYSDERAVAADISTIAQKAEQASPVGPCMLLIGAALARPAKTLRG
jgi:uroporphyrin-III C-methyltransferase / precorrin-2 dehydrogenase / sirohydrochlorin ferrochelatase